jgi:hypothetical protein
MIETVEVDLMVKVVAALLVVQEGIRVTVAVAAAVDYMVAEEAVDMTPLTALVVEAVVDQDLSLFHHPISKMAM